MKQKEPPASVEAERGVLGSMLISPSAIAICVEEISDQHFSAPAHRTIYTALVDLWDSGRSIDLITFTQELRDRNLLESVGGASAVTSLFTFVPTAANLEYYLEIVREKYILREIILASTEAVRRAYEQQIDVNGLLNEVSENIAGIGRRFIKRREIRQIVDTVLANFDTSESTLGISSGYPSLDDSIGGLAFGAKIVVAAAISGGKSALLQGMAKSLAVDRKIPTVIFTFEMSAEATVQRIIQIHSGVSTWQIAKHEAELFEIKSYGTAALQVGSSPLWVIAERLSIKGIKSVLMQLKPRVAMIDYIQIVPEPRLKGENRTDQLDRMSTETKQIAHQLNLTIIEASQLTETSEGMRTRGSRGITADCDILLMIESDGDAKVDGKSPKRIVNAKQRDGKKDQAVPFLFDGATTTFIERS